MFQNFNSFFQKIFKQQQRNENNCCSLCGNFSKSYGCEEPPFKRRRYAGVPYQRLDHLIPNCLVNNCTLKNLRCFIDKPELQEEDVDDEIIPNSNSCNMNSNTGSQKSICQLDEAPSTCQPPETNTESCDLDCFENVTCSDNQIPSSTFCDSAAKCTTQQEKKRPPKRKISSPQLNDSCKQAKCSTVTSIIPPCETPCPSPYNKANKQLSCSAAACLATPLSLDLDQCDNDSISDRKAFSVFKNHLNSMPMEDDDDECDNDCGKSICHEKPEDLWAKMQISQKLPYYWIAIKQCRPSCVPFENFKRFYENSGQSKLHSFKLRNKWNKMDYSQRLPFVLETYLAKITDEQMNCLDENNMRKYFNEYRRKSPRRVCS